MEGGNSRKFEGLQIARAVAALSVAYYHSWHVTMPFPAGTSYPIPWLHEHGGVAVEFFFAISGFVICLIVTSTRFNVRAFAVQRFFRLWPMWIASSVVFLDITRYIGRSANQTMGAFWYSLTLLPTEGYPFLDVGWSLQHEVAFYALAALLVPRFGLIALAAVLAFGAALDEAIELPWYLHQYLSYYPFFLSGIAAYLALPALDNVSVRYPKLRIVLALLAGVLLLTQASRLFLPAATFLLLVGFLWLSPATAIGRLFVALGDASYSIYLIHVLVFYFVYIKLQEPLPPIWTQELLRYGALIAICIIALMTWHLIERPMIRFGRHLTTKLKPAEVGAS